MVKVGVTTTALLLHGQPQWKQYAHLAVICVLLVTIPAGLCYLIWGSVGGMIGAACIGFATWTAWMLEVEGAMKNISDMLHG